MQVDALGEHRCHGGHRGDGGLRDSTSAQVVDGATVLAAGCRRVGDAADALVDVVDAALGVDLAVAPTNGFAGCEVVVVGRLAITSSRRRASAWDRPQATVPRCRPPRGRPSACRSRQVGAPCQSMLSSASSLKAYWLMADTMLTPGAQTVGCTACVERLAVAGEPGNVVEHKRFFVFVLRHRVVGDGSVVVALQRVGAIGSHADDTFCRRPVTRRISLSST